MNNQPLSLITFPIWWYSEGLVLAWRHCVQRCQFILRSTGLLIFVKNLTQPLYGDTTREGRAVSIFIRCILVIFLFFWTIARLLGAVALFFLHIVALPIAVIMIVFQLFNIIA